MKPKHDEGAMGQYLREYRPRNNFNTYIHELRSPRYAFPPAAFIVQQKRLPDVSFYQGLINWDMLRGMTDAVFIRAGQNEWIDTQFLRNWSEARRLNMYRGVYWFFDGRKSPDFQAGLLVSLIRNDPPEMEIAIDWERNYGGAYEGIANVVAMMQRVEELMPEARTMLYTGYYWFRDNSNPITNTVQYNYLRTRPLWLAWYTSNPSVVIIPQPWDALTYWQFGTPSLGAQYGVQTIEIDMNYFNGQESEFYDRYAVQSPPPNGGTMQRFRVNNPNGSGLNLRPAPSSNNTVILNVPTDTYVWGVDDGTNWLHISHYQRPNEQYATALDCYGYKPLVILDGSGDPPMPPSAENRQVTVTVEEAGWVTVSTTLTQNRE